MRLPTSPLHPYVCCEFFAGGGMVRIGLGDGWVVSLANDIDPKKAAIYIANFGGDHFKLGDVADITPAELPGRADLFWASPP
jgi:DNA (cytosine-5)-methyltransferase 1